MEMIKYKMCFPPCHLFIRLSTCLITSPFRLGSCFSHISFFLETATLQFNFASGHLSTSIPPPLQPCMNSFLCFNLSLFSMFVFFPAYIIYLPLYLPSFSAHLSLPVHTFFHLSINLLSYWTNYSFRL